MISRKTERRLIKVMGIWQIIDGMITILYYGIYQQMTGAEYLKGAFAEVCAINDMFGNVFILISVFGMLLIVLGMLNLLFALRYVKDSQVHIGIGIVLIIEAVISYFMLDIISMVLGMSAGVILLARNKSIQVHVRNN